MTPPASAGHSACPGPQTAACHVAEGHMPPGYALESRVSRGPRRWAQGRDEEHETANPSRGAARRHHQRRPHDHHRRPDQGPRAAGLPSGGSVCELRSPATRAARTARPASGRTSPTTSTSRSCGAQGENCSRFLAKGRPVAIDGRLEWREWETPQGAKRASIDIIADSVQFLGSRDKGQGGGFAGRKAAVAVRFRSRAGLRPSPVGSVADEDFPF